MWAEDGSACQRELEGWPVSVTCYRISNSYVTQIEFSPYGTVIARGIAATREDAENQAFETAKERLLLNCCIELMVGG